MRDESNPEYVDVKYVANWSKPVLLVCVQVRTVIVERRWVLSWEPLQPAEGRQFPRHWEITCTQWSLLLLLWSETWMRYDNAIKLNCNEDSMDIKICLWLGVSLSSNNCMWLDGDLNHNENVHVTGCEWGNGCVCVDVCECTCTYICAHAHAVSLFHMVANRTLTRDSFKKIMNWIKC